MTNDTLKTKLINVIKEVEDIDIYTLEKSGFVQLTNGTVIHTKTSIGHQGEEDFHVICWSGFRCWDYSVDELEIMRDKIIEINKELEDHLEWEKEEQEKYNKQILNQLDEDFW